MFRGGLRELVEHKIWESQAREDLVGSKSNLFSRCGIHGAMEKDQSFVILAAHRCSEYLCDFAADGFVLDPEGNGIPGGVYCERCARKIVEEYNEKVSPGWVFQPGTILGGLSERPPAAPRPPEGKPVRPKSESEQDWSFHDHVEDILTS